MRQKDQKNRPPPTPVLDRGAAQELNLTVLRRIDPDIEEVLATAGHVCLYHMSVDTQQWARKNVEGSLFVLKRRSQPRFQMMVLNKLCTENYVETVHGGLDFEVNAPYLMYTHGNAEIHGIWFYEKEDLEKISSLLTRLLHTLPKPDYSSIPLPQGAANGQDGASEGSFWDKPKPAAANPANTPPLLPFGGKTAGEQTPLSGAPLTQAPGGSGEGVTNLASLLRKAHAQTQNPPAPDRAPSPFSASTPQPSISPPPPSIEPVAEGALPLLPPSFFQKPAAKPLENLKKPAALSPSSSMDSNAGGLGRTSTQEEKNPLKQLFARARKEVQTIPTPAPPIPVQPAAAEVSSAPPSVLTQPQTQRPTTNETVTRDRLRQALIRLVANDAFVDMLSAELRSAGLLE